MNFQIIFIKYFYFELYIHKYLNTLYQFYSLESIVSHSYLKVNCVDFLRVADCVQCLLRFPGTQLRRPRYMPYPHRV